MREQYASEILDQVEPGLIDALFEVAIKFQRTDRAYTISPW